MFTLHLHPCTLTAFYFFEWIITLVIYSVAPLSGHSVGAHASWLLYHFLQDPIIFWLLHCFLAQNVLESSWTFSWELEAISPRGQEVPRSGAKRNYCSQAFSVDTHTDVCTISPCGHPPHPAWHLSPLTGPIPTPTPTMPTANEQLMSQTPGRRSTLRPFLSEVKEQGWQRVALQGVWPGAGGAVHSFPGRVTSLSPTVGREMASGSGATAGSHVVRGLSHHWATPGTRGWWHSSSGHWPCHHEDSHVGLSKAGTHHPESPDPGLSSEVDGFGTSSSGQKWVRWCPAV